MAYILTSTVERDQVAVTITAKGYRGAPAILLDVTDASGRTTAIASLTAAEARALAKALEHVAARFEAGQRGEDLPVVKI